MAKVNLDYDTVSEELHGGDDDSVTVPTGEVWIADISISAVSDFRMHTNNNIVKNPDSGESHHWEEVILTGGTFLKNQGANNSYVSIRGFVVDDIENDVLQVEIEGSESVTVPSGESWTVTAYFSSQATLELNGMHSGLYENGDLDGDGWHIRRQVFHGGDELFNDGSGFSYIILCGWVTRQ